MKKRLLFWALLGLVLSAAAQQMQVKQYNFTSFSNTERRVSDFDFNTASKEAQLHPEFGRLPFNSPCQDCFEVTDKRTADSRFYYNAANVGYTYSQKSYFPLHYKKKGENVWRTIDHRLELHQPNVYAAMNQPVPAKCDLLQKTTSLMLDDFEFVFNRQLAMYFIQPGVAQSAAETGSYSHFTIGEEGLEVKDFWPGINMQQIFKAGSIKTNYVINEPLSLPIETGWMVIEDHFSLPEGFSCIRAAGRTQHSSDDLIIADKEGDIVALIERPVYLDAYAFGQHGTYELLNIGNDYTLKMLVPVEWLNRADHHYPITIDPSVNGFTKIGDFTNQGLSSQMGFTSIFLGACDYHLNVTVPGKSELKRAMVDLEYTLTYDNSCGNPPLGPPFCTFSQIGMRVKNDSCNLTTDMLSCKPAQPPFTGTCTTNPLLVPGASSLDISSFIPGFLSCYPPQCPDYDIPFTLYNTDSICGDVCGYLCARGNMWQMTIEAERLSASITVDTNAVLQGDIVILTAQPEFGVPPYTYLWSNNGGLSYDTTNFPITNMIVNADLIISCLVVDACGETFVTNDTSVYMIPVSGFNNKGQSTSADITIKPVPVYGKLLLNSPEHSFSYISLYDIEGSLISRMTFQTQIDVSSLTSGIYIVQLESSDFTIRKRILKY